MSSRAVKEQLKSSYNRGLLTVLTDLMRFNGFNGSYRGDILTVLEESAQEPMVRSHQELLIT